MSDLSSLVERAHHYKIHSYYNYTPSKPLAIVALCLYAATTFFHIFQIIKYKAWFWTVVVVAGLMQTAGYLSRVLSAEDVSNRGKFIGAFALVVLAPVFTAAGDYLLLGRLLSAVLPGGLDAKTLGVPARRIILLFVSSDIFSFLLQGAGAGIMSGNSDGLNPKASELGSHIMLTGLAIQLCFFTFFTLATVRFDIKTRKIYAGQTRPKWRFLLYSLYVSCLLILIRSCYRIAEFSQGWFGYLASHEVFFYCFEALPMLPCLVIFNIFHPKILPEWQRTKMAHVDGSDTELEHSRADKSPELA